MYNLFVTFTKNQWEKGAYEYRPDRVIKIGTDNDLKDRFSSLDESAVEELLTFPCLFVYEEGQGDEIRIGWLTRIKQRGHETRIEFEIEEEISPLSRDQLKPLLSSLDLRNELTTTHWAVKDVDLFRVLIKAGILNEKDLSRQPADSRIARFGMTKSITQMQIRPSVFRVPTAKPDSDLVSVMMPFEAAFDGVFNAIKAACKESGLKCKRADGVWDEPEVIQDVFSLIYRSRVVICDFTGRNPNVFYEAGIAHTLGRTVIPIVQNKNDVPFDLGHIRYIKYLDNREGRSKLRTALAEKLQSLTKT
jgi:hypothetical protein